MFNVRATITQRPPLEKIAKQIIYGTAVGLTKTAKEGQAAVVGALHGQFTLRNKWFQQQTPVGIKIKPATKGDLTAEIYTRAPFLPRQQKGGVKLPFGNHLAIPAPQGPLGHSKRVIPGPMRPKALIASGKAFIVTLKSGQKVIAARGLKKRGAFKGFTIVYFLVPRATIKAVDIFYGPIEKVVNRRMRAIIDREIGIALTQIR